MTLLLALLPLFQPEELPPRAIARLGSRELRLNDRVNRMAFSPDGKGLFLAGHHDAGYWTLADRRQVARAQTLYNSWGVGFAFGNVPVALCDNGAELHLINLASGKDIQVFKNRRGWFGAALSPDGTLIAGANHGGAPIQLFDSVEGRKLRELAGHGDLISDLAFSPDGKSLVTASYDKSVRVWDVASGEQKKFFQGHADKITCLALSRDGKTIASGGFDRTIRFWDAPVEPIEVGADVYGIAFSPDGKSLAAIVSGSMRVLDLAARKELFRVPRPAEVGVVAFSPDGKTLAATVGAGVRFWELPAGKEQPGGPAGRGAVHSVGWSPDGASLVVAGDNVAVWDVARRAERFRGEKRADRAAFSPDGKTVAVGGMRSLRLLDARTGAELRKVDAHATQVTALAWSPDGTSLLSGGPDKQVKLWDPGTGREQRRLEGHEWPNCAAFSPDGTRIATGDGATARLWSAADGKLLRTLGKPGGQVMSIAFSPDGKSVALGTNTAQIVDPETGLVLQNLPGPRAAVSAVAWSPDGKFLAGAPLDNKIRIWEVSTGRQLHFLDGHGIQIHALAFSPDGRTLASGSQDTTVLLWDLGFLKD